MYGNNQFMIDNLSRQRERLDDMIKNYQTLPQAPINNIITGAQIQDNTYEMKKLNDNDEVENISIFKDTIFIGEDRLQIKKVDGTIEKYEIRKIYPRDKKDDKIDELNKKIEELERRLNDEHTKPNEPTERINKSNVTTDVNAKSTTKAISKPISK